MSFGEPVTVITGSAGGEDSSGEPTPGDPTSVTYDGCVVWRASSDEIEQVGGDPVVTHDSISFPADAIVPRGATVIVRGEPAIVIGFPFLWRDPHDGLELGIVAIVKQVK